MKNAEKIRELKSLLKKAGFIYRSAKGSHTRWYHPLLPEDPITISGKDGDDAKIYIENEVNEKLAKLKSIQKEKSKE
ncbi:MAG: type II toxin-antitoxin system HicA family toxin [Aphanizomenon gracile PMC644.10]|nr:type II toxin-antitoxin system HicA family toxin [Aphanizomenon gracile PMC627.10]MDM3858415.1 type II toxin-antitoxin system HicA family toxin [Aphanizomenon gracile PMC644.10]